MIINFSVFCASNKRDWPSDVITPNNRWECKYWDAWEEFESKLDRPQWMQGSKGLVLGLSAGSGHSCLFLCTPSYKNVSTYTQKPVVLHLSSGQPGQMELLKAMRSNEVGCNGDAIVNGALEITVSQTVNCLWQFLLLLNAIRSKEVGGKHDALEMTVSQTVTVCDSFYHGFRCR